MNYAFQDRENLYLAMDLMVGGDLRFHINRIKIFSEEQSSKKKNPMKSNINHSKSKGFSLVVS